MPETSTDLVKGSGRREGGEFAKPPDMLDEWRAVGEEGPQLTGEPALSGACNPVRVELGGALTSPQTRSAPARFRPPRSSSLPSPPTTHQGDPGAPDPQI